MAMARSLRPMSFRSSSRADRRAARHLLALPVFLFAGTIVLALAYVAYVLWPRWPAPIAPDAPALPITIANVTFNIPPGAIRQRVQRKPGTQQRIDLSFLWPSLQPPDANAQLAPVASSQAVDRIFMTIMAADNALAPAERIKSIYPRYLDTRINAGPGGLAARPFRPDTPYQDEELIYDAESNAFVVRCTRDGPGPTLGICLYDVRIGSADLTVRFPRLWLQDWRSVAGRIDALIRSFHAHGG